MANYKNFEDLPIWQESRLLTKKIYEITQSLAFSKDRNLSDQIRRAAISVVSNIAEGFERTTDKDFAHFLNIAKASAGEIRAQLYIALDIGYIDETTHHELNDSFKLLASQIGGFMNYLRGTK